MKKLIKSCMICLLLAMCFAGCKKQEADQPVNQKTVPAVEQLEAIGTQLLSAGVFEGEMAEVNKKMVKEAYKLEQEIVLVSYMSTASKADEITIIQTEDVSTIENLVNTYIEDRKQTFESYAPEECTKLEQALTVTYGLEDGVCVICISSKKEEAKKIIEECVK